MQAALAAEEMLYDGKGVTFALGGTELAGVTATLKCFVRRDVLTDRVLDEATSAALGFLREHDALPVPPRAR